MENETNEQLDASFDIVSRQEAAEQALGALRSDVAWVAVPLSKALPLRPASR